jgi:hypothetical protein
MSIAAIVSTLTGPIAGLISEFVLDKDKQAELSYKIATLAATQAHEQTIAQLAVNKTEAAHKNMFVAGWRPAVGWTCAVAMANNFILVPYMVAFGFDVPSLDLAEMMPVLLGMLGLGGMRSFEKAKGVAREK